MKQILRSKNKPRPTQMTPCHKKLGRNCDTCPESIKCPPERKEQSIECKTEDCLDCPLK
jgi:hypothetical protein